LGSRFLDSFLIRSTRETLQAGSSNSPHKESHTQQTVSASNEVISLIKDRDTTQQSGCSNAPQEGCSTLQSVRASNKGSLLQFKGITQQAGSSVAVQQNVCTNEDGLATRPQSEVMPHELCDLDEEVLAALPEDIRQEVLQTYQSRSSSQVQKDETVTSVKSQTVDQVLEHVIISMSNDLSTNFKRGTVT
jgi:hypothetical protein